jgi:hypothetical protein
MISNYRHDIVKESLHELHTTLLMQRSNESVLNMNSLNQHSKDKARATASECNEKVVMLRKTIEHQIDHLKSDLLQVEKEIEILGGGYFADLEMLRNVIKNKIQTIQKEYQHANTI